MSPRKAFIEGFIFGITDRVTNYESHEARLTAAERGADEWGLAEDKEKRPEKFHPFRIEDYVNTPEQALAYLRACRDEGGTELFWKALHDLAQGKPA